MDTYNDHARHYQQNDHKFNFNHIDSQMQTGNAYPMAQHYGPGPQDFQFSPMRGVPQQAFMNHRPPLQMDYLPGPAWQQGQQYNTRRMYPHIAPTNYYLQTHSGGASYYGDLQWTTPFGYYPEYPLPLASGKMAKMLHSTNRDHILVFCSQSTHEDVTEIFCIQQQ